MNNKEMRSSAKLKTQGGLLTGAALLIPTFGFAYFLTPAHRIDFFGVLLAIVGAIYIGFVLKDEGPREKVIEIANAVFILLLTLLGMWVDPVWLAAGFFCHGVWDLLHHPRGLRTKIPRWYIPACLVYDWVVGVYILLAL